MKRTYILYTCWLIAGLILSVTGVYAQQTGQGTRTVGGVVEDDKGPMENVSIYEKDQTGNGTISDEKGRFRLTLKGKQRILVFTRLNYLSQEVKISGSSEIKVTMTRDAKGMDEVVVVGYGQVKKVTLTGAVSSISREEIMQSPSASLQNTLAGRLPGFFSEQRSGQPGSDAASFQIRGISSYTSSTTPLIMVDDIEFNISQLSQIDPNEIESLSILKDASATAVYGVRGANGVVVIRTRRGVAGRPQLTIRNEYGLQSPTLKPKTNSGYTTLLLLKEYETNQGLNPVITYPQYFAGNNLNFYKTNSDPNGHPDVNWWNELLRKQSPQNLVDFDITGGSNLIKYFISMSYLTQGGIYKDFTRDLGYNDNYFYNRYNFRSNIDIDPSKSLKVRVDLSGRFGIQNTPNDAPWNNGGTTFQYLWDGELSPFGYPVYNPNGTFGGTPSTSTKPNPVANLMYSGYNRAYDDNLNLVASAIQKLDVITRGLSAMALISDASDFTFKRSLTRAANTVPTYTLDTTVKPNVYKPVTPNLYQMGPLSRTGSGTGTSQMLNIQASLNYARSFGDNNVSGLFLLNQNTNTTDAVASNVFVAGTPVNYKGLVSRVTYNYKLRYLLDIEGAYNGSDRFQGSKRYGLFPSVSAGWNIAEESFFKNNIHFVNALKIRGSYGLVGTDNIGSYQYLYQQIYNPTYGYNFGNPPTYQTGLSEGAYGNNVTWEKVKKSDLGTDISLFKGTVNVTADYFHEYRYDILTTRGTVPAVFGVGLPPVNLGRVVNHGYELDVRYNGKSGKLTYFVDGQVTFARNKILFMDEPVKNYPYLAQTGKSIGQIFGYTWTGYYNSLKDLQSSPLPTGATPMVNIYPGDLKLADLNKDGHLDINDEGALGSNQPQYIGGLSFGVAYKGFDVSVLFQGAFDYVVNINEGILAYSRPDRQSSPFNLGRWTPENKNNATYPTLDNGITNGYTSSFWTRSGNYVRFKNFEVGYTLPSSLTKKVHFRNIRLYVNGYDLGLIYSSLPFFVDPESASSASTIYPQERIVNFGLQLGL